VKVGDDEPSFWEPLTVVTAMVSGVTRSGGLRFPKSVFPQHTGCPVVLIPQASWPLPLNWVKVPAGGLVSPVVVTPQHVAVPVVLIPQAKE
jgi:hypothetical protein